MGEKTVFVSILTYGHESWVITERVTIFNKKRGSEIRKSVNVNLLLLRIERAQLRWFGYVSKMP